MALPTSIDNILSGTVVEHERLELKETWDAAASLKTICAFANDIDNWGGGYIVIGISERDGRRTIVGVEPSKVDSWLKDILNKCKLLRPSYMPVADVAEYEGKTLIVLWCPGGSVRPYSAPKTMGKGERERICYIRKAASTIEPTQQELRELYALADNVPFDDRPNHNAELTDLNLALIRSHLGEVGSDLFELSETMDFEDLCRAMKIVDGPKEYVKPRNVGLLFFAHDPERFFPCARIEVVEFPDGLGGDRLIEHVFTGPLTQQLRNALTYLKGNVIAEMVTKLPDRAEAERIYNYPFAAIEEALSNAVYHKGYDVREPIEVRVLPDTIEILSYPGADRSISIEGLRHFRAITRRYRNRRIGDFLKELGLTEGRNTGFHKILRALRENGSPEPCFETDEERLYFLTTLYIHPAFAQATHHPHTQLEQKGLSEREQVVLAYLSEHPKESIAVISAALGIPKSSVSRVITNLKEMGLLERVGSTRNGKWVVHAG